MRFPPRVLAAVAVLGFAGFSPGPLAAQEAPVVSETAETPKIEGIAVERPGGGYLGFKTEGVVLRVTFYDAKKKMAPAEAVRISARWTDGRPRSTVLLPSAPETLSSPGVFQRPYSYIVYFALVGADDKVIETHSLRLQGSEN